MKKKKKKILANKDFKIFYKSYDLTVHFELDNPWGGPPYKTNTMRVGDKEYIVEITGNDNEKT